MPRVNKFTLQRKMAEKRSVFGVKKSAEEAESSDIKEQSYEMINTVQ